MPYKVSRRLGIASLITTIGLSATVAEAQMAPGGMGGGMGGPQTGPSEEKKEGVAQEAPKTPGLLPTTPALPAPKGRRKKWKLIDIEGYFRFRTDWYKNFNLGFRDRAVDGTSLGGAPFPRALGCTSDDVGAECNNLSGANMRLRLEPVINLDEGTSIHIQADVLDNLVLGSTPTGTDNGAYASSVLPPLGAFTTNQAPPQAGVNSDRDSITIKRAWAEVAIPLGILKVGRMPNHWGMGLFHNGGAKDPTSGRYDYESDYGDTVDRVSFSALIPGTPLRAMLASDWNGVGIASNQTLFNRGNEGHPFDLDDKDDANGWVGVISKMDTPQEFKDTVDRGDLAINYGVYFEYKTQSWDYNLTDFVLGGMPDTVNAYVPRGMKTYSPDLWFKLGYKGITWETEVIADLGSIDRLDDLGKTVSANIRKFGGATRLDWRGLEGKLRLGVEGGFATGDQWDNTPEGNTNVAFANLLGVCPTGTTCPADGTLSQMIFDREYKVDLILWRRLVGAVTNAGYIKPSISYDITKSIGFTVANVTSFALNTVATPGNDRMYGTEFDADIGYRVGNFSFSLWYGVLFPFAAMNHIDDRAANPRQFTWGTDPLTGQGNVGTASTAHTIQSRLVLSF